MALIASSMNRQPFGRSGESRVSKEKSWRHSMEQRLEEGELAQSHTSADQKEGFRGLTVGKRLEAGRTTTRLQALAPLLSRICPPIREGAPG